MCPHNLHALWISACRRLAASEGFETLGGTAGCASFQGRVEEHVLELANAHDVWGPSLTPLYEARHHVRCYVLDQYLYKSIQLDNLCIPIMNEIQDLIQYF